MEHVNYSGTWVFCQECHQMGIRDLNGSTWSEIEEIQFPSLELTDFPACETLSYAHPKYCGDDPHVFVTVSCKVGDEIMSTELVLFEWDGRHEAKSVAFLGRSVTDAFGVVDGQSYQGQCLEKPS